MADYTMLYGFDFIFLSAFILDNFVLSLQTSTRLYIGYNESPINIHYTIHVYTQYSLLDVASLWDVQPESGSKGFLGLTVMYC